jgi:hypothetical protein
MFVLMCICMHHIPNTTYRNGVRVETVDLDCRCLCCKTSYTTTQQNEAAATVGENTTAVQRKRSSLLRSSKAAATAAVRDAAVISSNAAHSNDENIQPVYSNSDNSTTVKSKAKCPSCDTCTGPQELFFNPTDENVTEALLQQSSHSRTNSKSSINDKKSKACCSCECSSCHCANSSNSAQRKGQYIRL